MKTFHLSEEQLQAYAENPAAVEAALRLHADSCPDCQAAATPYRIVFSGLHEFKTDHFDFDLAGAVLANLPPSKPKLTWSVLGTYLGIAASILLTCLSVTYGIRLLSGLPNLGLISILTVAFMIATHQAILSLYNYRRKMARLKIY